MGRTRCMNIQSLGSRSRLISWQLDDWTLHQQLILGTRYDFLIDTGLGEDMAQQVMQLHEGRGQQLIVINTHHHWDHTWGNHAFSDAPIIAHMSCPDLMESRWQQAIASNGHYAHGQVACRLPSILFERGMIFPEEGIRLFHSPGHTLDSISVYDERDQILNIGDNIGDRMEELVPSLAVPKDIYRQTIERYIQLPAITCLGGHLAPFEPTLLKQLVKELES